MVKIKYSLLQKFGFLKAEAAIRGYAGAGDAKTNYEKGIQTSFDEWGKGAGYSTYIADGTSTEAPYIDPKTPSNSITPGSPMLSTITIKWNDGDNFEKKAGTYYYPEMDSALS